MRLWPGLCHGSRWRSLLCSPRPPSWIWGNGEEKMERVDEEKGTEGKGKDGEKREEREWNLGGVCVVVFRGLDRRPWQTHNVTLRIQRLKKLCTQRIQTSDKDVIIIISCAEVM